MSILSILLLLASPASASDARFASQLNSFESKQAVLRVMTFNIFGVKPFAEMSEQERVEAQARFSDIGAELARLRREGRAPHVVAIQEAFHWLTDPVVTVSGYPHSARGPGAKLPSKPFSSGLIVLSEYPLEEAVNEAYLTCTSWDCLANKGIQFVRVRVPGVPGGVAFYNSHLNADTDGVPVPDSRGARLEQVRHLLAFIPVTRRGSAALFAADFNFRLGDPDYAAFASQPGIRNVAVQCAATRACSGEDPTGVLGDLIDHHFYLPSQDGRVTLEPVHFLQTFREPINGRMPSDHFAVETTYLIRWDDHVKDRGQSAGTR